MENLLKDLTQGTLPEIKLCYGCNRLKLIKDIHNQASLLSNSRTESKSKLDRSERGSNYKREYTTTSIASTNKEVTLCNMCWDKLEEGIGIKDPSIPEPDEIHIDTYKSDL
jgi:hypothetical protein